MNRLTLHIPGDPMATPRPRATVRGGHGATYMPSDYTKWKVAAATTITEQLLRAGDLGWMSGGCRVHLEVVFARQKTPPKGVSAKEWKAGARRRKLSKPDADNLWKAAVDALCLAMVERMGLVWDDCLCDLGGSDRWHAAAGEKAGMRLVVEDVDWSPPF